MSLFSIEADETRHNQQEAVVASSIRGKAGWGQGKNLPCLDNSPFVPALRYLRYLKLQP